MLKDKNLKITDLHGRIRKSFAEKAVTYRTLQRILAGHTEATEISLYQICIGLGISLRDLKKNPHEKKSSTKYIPRNSSEGLYFYNPDAYAKILTDPNESFSALQLMLKPGAKTLLEKDPKGTAKYTKWIFVLKGSLACTVEGKKNILKKGDAFTFDSRLEHSFENYSSKTANCIIVQNPRNL